MDHLKLLCDFGELNWVFTGSKDTQSFLDKIVALVRRHMEADVCAIYLYDSASRELVLEAADGTEGGGVGRVRLPLGQGLSGLALLELRPIRAREGRKHPAFRYVPGSTASTATSPCRSSGASSASASSPCSDRPRGPLTKATSARCR